MARLFDGRVGAFAYLLFILLYFPCVAAISAVYRETNFKWTAFVGVWTTGLAYMASTIFYQVATIGRHPAAATTWVTVMLCVFIAVILILRYFGGKDKRLPRGVLDGAQA